MLKSLKPLGLRAEKAALFFRVLRNSLFQGESFHVSKLKHCSVLLLVCIITTYLWKTYNETFLQSRVTEFPVEVITPKSYISPKILHGHNAFHKLCLGVGGMRFLQLILVLEISHYACYNIFYLSSSTTCASARVETYSPMISWNPHFKRLRKWLV